MQDNTIDPAAPEWASRLLPISETAAIEGVNPSTVYRRIDAGIYPKLIHIGSSSRMPGWELWDLIKAKLAARDEAAK